MFYQDFTLLYAGLFLLWVYSMIEEQVFAQPKKVPLVKQTLQKMKTRLASVLLLKSARSLGKTAGRRCADCNDLIEVPESARAQTEQAYLLCPKCFSIEKVLDKTESILGHARVQTE